MVRGSSQLFQTTLSTELNHYFSERYMAVTFESESVNE